MLDRLRLPHSSVVCGGGGLPRLGTSPSSTQSVSSHCDKDGFIIRNILYLAVQSHGLVPGHRHVQRVLHDDGHLAPRGQDGPGEEEEEHIAHLGLS